MEIVMQCRNGADEGDACDKNELRGEAAQGGMGPRLPYSRYR
jgi:hypothetical protein